MYSDIRASLVSSLQSFERLSKVLNYWCILHASVEHTVGTNSVSVAAVRRLDEIFKSVLGNCICLVTKTDRISLHLDLIMTCWFMW